MKALDEILVVDVGLLLALLELLLLCLVDTEVHVDFLLATLVDVAVDFWDVGIFDDVDCFDVVDCLLEVLVFLVEVELLAAEDALVEIEASFNVVLIEVVAFFVDEVVFLTAEEVTLIVDEDFFVELVVFFAAATDEDEAEASTHLHALLIWATVKPLTVDFDCLVASHVLQYATGCLLLLFTVLISLALQAGFGQQVVLALCPRTTHL